MHTPRKPLILIEFNELTPSLMHRFMEAGKLPNFQKFYSQAHIYTTDAEEEGNLLNPWVQWVTVHTGLSAAEHGVQNLAEGYRLSAKAVWDYLSDAGFKVWVCGSMNCRYDRPLNGYLLSDPWSKDTASYPEGEFDAYWNFVAAAVQEHTNEARSVSKKDAMKFLGFMLRHGLSFQTVRTIIKQLWDERRGRNRWRRAVILDRLQWDVFRHVYRKSRPDFATFFLNSTAHFQHTYWRHLEPERFQVRPAPQEIAEYGGAIEYGYRNMDQLLGELMDLAEPDCTLVFCTALSQQPYLKSEASGGRHYYRIKDPSVLTELLGIQDPFEPIPVMAEQLILRFAGEEACQRAKETLKIYRFKDRSVFHAIPSGRELSVQCSYSGAIAEDDVITVRDSSRTLRFLDVFYPMNVLKSGMHHPDGMMWVRHPSREHKVHDGKVSICAIAPAILEHFGITPPRSNGWPGQSAREPNGAILQGAAPKVCF